VLLIWCVLLRIEDAVVGVGWVGYKVVSVEVVNKIA
jgi:hypothetical protein